MFDKQRKVVTSGDLWKRYKAFCKRRRIGMNDTINALVAGIASGDVEIEVSKRITGRGTITVEQLPEVMFPSDSDWDATDMLRPEDFLPEDRSEWPDSY